MFRSTERNRYTRKFVALGLQRPWYRRVAWTRLVAALLALAIIGQSALAGLSQRRQAQAQLINYTVGDLSRILEFFEIELQEISVDLVRKIVIEQVTKKMIEKIIGGQQGGIGGNTSAASNNGQGGMIADYGQFIFYEANKDVLTYIDEEFERQFPSTIDASIKDAIKQQYEVNPQYVPDDCVDIKTIKYGSDEDAYEKTLKAVQPGCNNLSAQVMLYELAAMKNSQIIEASKTEAVANSGLLKKDEKDNLIEQAGPVLEGIVQAMLQSVADVQTNNESAVASIIGSLVDQLLDEILDQSF